MVLFSISKREGVMKDIAEGVEKYISDLGLKIPEAEQKKFALELTSEVASEAQSEATSEVAGEANSEASSEANQEAAAEAAMEAAGEAALAGARRPY